jgi:uncharacterized RmlC-like cupin family protein
MSTGVRRIRPDERTEGPATAGMIREEAVATTAMWAGFVRTDPGMESGWHHHGAFESVIFVATGALVMEFGPGGRETLEARPGDFLYVAPGAIHRESNPTAEESHIIVVRSGSGTPVINVDGPEETAGRTRD